MQKPIYLHNTLSREKEEFVPLREGEVKMYNCGPTAYDYQHVGNLSAAVFADVLRRVLEYNDYKVEQVINITDFGHLTSDADEGEDKMTVGLQREGLTLTLENMMKLAGRYADAYLDDIAQLNVGVEKIQFPRASEYIEAQIALIQTLEGKDYAYELDDGVYFDTQHFPNYGALGGQANSEQEAGARVAGNPNKRDPKDFVLWKKDSNLGWKSPWGMGFPGWHIECSGMIFALLGRQIDIHTGGVEHIGVHHNNEIAQSEAATGRKPFAKYWLHRAHIQLEDTKISKSLGNTAYLRDLPKHNIIPMAYRYWLLTAHYRTPSNFTWDALEGAQTALKKLRRAVSESPEGGTIDTTYQEKFQAFVNDDLDTPKALALAWDLVKDDAVSQSDKRATLLDFDRVFGLNLGTTEKEEALEIPDDIQALKKERDQARESKDFAKSDELRDKINEGGYSIEDTPQGSVLGKL